ncbi:hypothetical protein QQP08_002010 [Theobroma cacao]|uniref:Uncharacterized protein n=1 Tax=Theobroma cacao TaxID=3641 RepID=A0A061DUR4_THECC|nr:Uncharacterized protein TCM_005218 [Theobroma cacao]WRX09523.1 hypothetical protein QQP08_002010 [Theobroma cacao]
MATLQQLAHGHPWLRRVDPHRSGPRRLRVCMSWETCLPSSFWIANNLGGTPFWAVAVSISRLRPFEEVQYLQLMVVIVLLDSCVQVVGGNWIAWNQNSDILNSSNYFATREGPSHSCHEVLLKGEDVKINVLVEDVKVLLLSMH